MDKHKRYQIFVSSTFRDLEEERGKVMETILNFNCFPAGMELFPAMDEDIFKYIKRIIDESDYYLLIIGGRYGSVDKGGVSWTEREYDYAVSKGIPVLVFDHEDFTKLPTNKTDQGRKRIKLAAFKKKASTGRLIKQWTNKDDLALAVSNSLARVLDLQPRIGWVRADSIPSVDTKREIERLREEIIKNKNEIKCLEDYLKKKDKDYQVAQKEIKTLKARNKTLEAEQKKLKASRSMPQVQTKTFTVNGVSFKMVHIEGGTFMMGNDNSPNSNEIPAHEVALSDYWIGETQVTLALWKAVMDVNPNFFMDDSNLPVERISWINCQEFIEKLNEMTGRKFHLPTEAQWEFAARGGNLGKDNQFLFAGGDDINTVAWYDDNSMEKTHPVREKAPNELGLYDMSGNVWEWCNDWYDENYYKNSSSNDPLGPISGSYRVVRGGSWADISRLCCVSLREFYVPTYIRDYLGLRLAL